MALEVKLIRHNIGETEADRQNIQNNLRRAANYLDPPPCTRWDEEGGFTDENNVQARIVEIEDFLRCLLLRKEEGQTTD